MGIQDRDYMRRRPEEDPREPGDTGERLAGLLANVNFRKPGAWLCLGGVVVLVVVLTWVIVAASG